MTHPSGQVKTLPRATRERWWATSVVVGWGLICLLAALLPDGRLWGFNHLAFLPWTARVVFAAMMAIAILLIWQLRKGSSSTRHDKSFIPGIRELVVLAVVFVAVAWSLRASTPLLGDGYLRGDEVERLAPGVNVITDCLPVWLTVHFHRLVPDAWNLSGRDTYAGLSIVGGLIYLLGLAFLWPRLRESDDKSTRLTWTQWLPVLWFLSVGAMQLFFGYVETYALSWTFLSLFTLAILAYRIGRLGWVWPVVLWVAAFFSHISAVAWAPLLLVEIYRRGRKENSFILPLTVSLIAVAGSIVTLWMIRPSGGGLFWSSYFLPLWGGIYSILDWRHLADILNQLILLCPVALVLLWSEPTKQEQSGRLRGLWLVWLPSLLAYVVLRSDLGWSRDWDLFCVVAAPAVMLMLFSLTRRLSSWSRPRLVAIAAVAVSSLSMWVWVNANENASFTRFGRLLALDPARSGSGHEVLARYWREHGNWNRVVDELGQGLAVGPHARLAIQRGIAWSVIGELDSALVAFELAIKTDSTQADAHFGAGQMLWALGQPAVALPRLERAVAADSNRTDYRYYLGMTLRDLKRPTEARPHLEFAATRNPYEPDYATAYAVTLYDLGDYPGALAVIDTTIARHPDYIAAELNKSWILYKVGRYSEATSALQIYEQRLPPDSKDPSPKRLRYLLDSVTAVTHPAPQ